MAQDVGLIYNGPWEKLDRQQRVELYNSFWDVIRDSGLDRRGQRSTIIGAGDLVRPFSVHASKFLRDKS